MCESLYVSDFFSKLLIRFRWTFCQLEVLRDCLPSSVRRFLEELPESLDETYERVLREIKKPNRDHARRLLQCLVVAIRPLRVEELAEVLAIDFDDASGIPTLNASWRWEDQERALLSSCSSLIAIVDTWDSRVVQFSHFSVKEYLTSERLATSSQDVPRFHITFETAHTILAQACVGVLLQVGDHDEIETNDAPLAAYSAEYWVRHAQFEDVASRIKGMEYLFDLDKPHFAAWRRLHDMDIVPRFGSVFYQFTPDSRFSANTGTPLYYAALCGFTNLVEKLIVKNPQHVNVIGGYYRTPAIAALAGRHFQLAKLLHRNKSSMEPRGYSGNTPLHSAVYYGDLEMAQVLLEYGVDVSAENGYHCTPLDFASGGRNNEPRVAQLLIKHGSNPAKRKQDMSEALGGLKPERRPQRRFAFHEIDNVSNTASEIVSCKLKIHRISTIVGIILRHRLFSILTHRQLLPPITSVTEISA